MPYKSEAQRRYFNANRDKLKGEGVDVDEWNASSKGKKLPEKVGGSPATRLLAGGHVDIPVTEFDFDGMVPQGDGSKESEHSRAEAVKIIADMFSTDKYDWLDETSEKAANFVSEIQQLAKLAASDGDNDGLVYDGTPRERKISVKDKVKSTKVEFVTGSSAKALKRKRKRKVHTKKAGLPMTPVRQLAKVEKRASGAMLKSLGKGLGWAAREIGGPAAAASAGYAMSPWINDKVGITSNLGRNATQFTQPGMMALLASPRFRRYLGRSPNSLIPAILGGEGKLYSKQLVNLGNQAMHAGKTKDQLQAFAKGIPNFGYRDRKILGPVTATGMLGVPTALGWGTDYSKQMADNFQSWMENNPEVFSKSHWAELPGNIAAEGVDRAKKEFKKQQEDPDSTLNKGIGQLQTTARSFGDDVLKRVAPVANPLMGGLAGGLAGSGLGMLASSALGKILMPEGNADYKNMDEDEYKSRRNRARLKTLLNVVGGYGGAAIGSGLGAKYLPGIIARLFGSKSKAPNSGAGAPPAASTAPAPPAASTAPAKVYPVNPATLPT
mgnify:CR=1 FL=1